MAEVFRVKAFGVEGFQKTFALKRILPHISEDPEFITMFIDEAKISSRLHHGNICQIYEFGRVGEFYFQLMEYIAGFDLRSLKEKLQEENKQLPLSFLLHVVARACEGLDYAHRKCDSSGNPLNIIHRDVSPQNIMIGFEGTSKIIDFGIAKAKSRASKTQAGVIKGKFAYMPPELLRGEPIDGRADVFSLGIVLHELLTGQGLFDRETDLDTLRAVMAAEVPAPSSIDPSIPDYVDKVVLKALTAQPADRYASAEDFQEDLERAVMMTGQPMSSNKVRKFMAEQFPVELNTELEKARHFASFSETGEVALHSGQPQQTPPKTVETFSGRRLKKQQVKVRGADAWPEEVTIVHGSSDSAQSEYDEDDLQVEARPDSVDQWQQEEGYDDAFDPDELEEVEGILLDDNDELDFMDEPTSVRMKSQKGPGGAPVMEVDPAELSTSLLSDAELEEGEFLDEADLIEEGEVLDGDDLLEEAELIDDGSMEAAETAAYAPAQSGAAPAEQQPEPAYAEQPYEGEYDDGEYDDGEWEDGEWEDGEYEEGEYAEGEYAEGKWVDGKWVESEPAEGEYAEGEYAEGKWVDGKWVEAEAAEGEYAEGEYAEGEYAEGKWVDGKWVEAEAAEGEYAEGEYAEGKWVDGKWVEAEAAEGEYEEGEYEEGEYEEGEYEEGEYEEGEYEEGEWVDGKWVESEPAEGEHAEGEYAEGEYEEGKWVDGKWVAAEAAGGEAAGGEYAEGEYAEGEYAEGEYAEGEYDDGEWEEGEYAEGEYAEGEYEGGDDAHEGDDELPTGPQPAGQYAAGQPAEAPAGPSHDPAQYDDASQGEPDDSPYADDEGVFEPVSVAPSGDGAYSPPPEAAPGPRPADPVPEPEPEPEPEPDEFGSAPVHDSEDATMFDGDAAADIKAKFAALLAGQDTKKKSNESEVMELGDDDLEVVDD